MTSRLLSYVTLTLVLIFLLGPFVIIVAAALSGGETLAFPPQGLSLKWVMKVFEVESFRASFEGRYEPSDSSWGAIPKSAFNMRPLCLAQTVWP